VSSRKCTFIGKIE